MQTRPIISKIDTSDLPQLQRTPKWENFNATNMVGLRCSTLDDQGVVARQLNIRGENHTAIMIEAQAHSITRSAEQITALPSDRAQISVVENGELYLHVRNGTQHFGSGEAFVFDTDQPYAMTMPQAVRLSSIHLKRSALKSDMIERLKTNGPIALNSIHSPGGDAVVSLLAEVDQRFYRPQDPRWSPDRLTCILGGIEEALHHARVCDGADISSVSCATDDEDARFRQASDLIARHARNPQLRLTDIAVHMHISERQLARVFARHHRTFRSLLVNERLSLLASDLADASHAHRTSSDIITACGFSSPAHGHRRFRALTGETPRQYRIRHNMG